MANSSFAKGLDWITIGVYLCLLLIGWLMLYAVVYDNSGMNDIGFGTIIGKQSMWILISLVVFGLSLFVDWSVWNSYSVIVYILGILLLVGVLIFGTEIKGAKSWFTFGFMSFQPSELAKIGTALLLARYTGFHQFTLKDSKSLWLTVGIILLPLGLILVQPDAGSALVFLSFFIVLYMNGMNPIIFIIGFLLLIIFITSLIFSTDIVLLSIFGLGILFFIIGFSKKLLWSVIFLIWIIGSIMLLYIDKSMWMISANIIAVLSLGGFHIIRKDRNKTFLMLAVLSLAILFSLVSTYAFNNVLKPHQQDRINVWLQPQKCDPRGSLYNLLQSKMAISSGGLEGRGYLKGTMTQMNFVPEQSTDFIFSTIGEEQGFIGSVGLILLFSFLFIRIVIIAERAKNKFIKNYAYGVLGVLLVHFFINIGMTIGLMPIVGIPLPFISKGGSSLAIFSLMIGILVRFDIEKQERRNKYVKKKIVILKNN